MAAVLAQIDLSDVDRGLDGISRRVRSLSPAFAAVKAAMKGDQREHCEQQAGPDGAWAPRAASTIAAAKREHRRLPRKVLGKLPTAVAYKAFATALVGESRVKWSLSHQEGGRVGRGAMLPARPFLWMSDKFLELAEGVFALMLARAWGGS